MLTYRELLKHISALPKDNLDDNVSVYIATEDEYYGVSETIIENDTSDVLDPGHLTLIVGV